jgi:gamma-glutamyl-gamma-aminobutyrate hydrolase PuuD
MSKRTAAAEKKAREMQERREKAKAKAGGQKLLPPPNSDELRPNQEPSPKDDPIRIEPPSNDVDDLDDDPNFSEPGDPAFAEPPTFSGERSIMTTVDTLLEFPDLYLGVFYIGPDFERRMMATWLMRLGCYAVTEMQDADVVIFGGGEDVDPAFYNAKNHPSTKANPDRDVADAFYYHEALDAGIPMVGICRGAQFLHVMNGGTLYQDVDGHQGPHAIVDRIHGRVIDRISSSHHQLVMQGPEDKMEIIATASKSTIRHIDDKLSEQYEGTDVEAFFYRDTVCLGIQGHPEYPGYYHYTQWCSKLLEHYITNNPDLERAESGMLRVRESLREERLMVLRAEKQPSKKKETT